MQQTGEHTGDPSQNCEEKYELAKTILIIICVAQFFCKKVKNKLRFQNDWGITVKQGNDRYFGKVGKH